MALILAERERCIVPEGSDEFLTPAEPKVVLIIDDDLVHLKLYRWMLQNAGFQSIEAQVGSEVVDVRKGQRVDIVLLDYLYKSSLIAPEIAEQVRQAHPHAHIVLLSQLEWMPTEMTPFTSVFFPKSDPGALMNYLKKLA